MYGGACVRGLCRGDLGMLKKNKTQGPTVQYKLPRVLLVVIGVGPPR